MSIEKLMKRKNENIISGIFFFFLVALSLSLSLSLSFYLIGNPNPHIPPICLYP